MLRAVCGIGLKVCLKGLLQLNRGVLVFPGRQWFPKLGCEHTIKRWKIFFPGRWWRWRRGARGRAGTVPIWRTGTAATIWRRWIMNMAIGSLRPTPVQTCLFSYILFPFSTVYKVCSWFSTLICWYWCAQDSHSTLISNVSLNYLQSIKAPTLVDLTPHMAMFIPCYFFYPFLLPFKCHKDTRNCQVQ